MQWLSAMMVFLTSCFGMTHQTESVEWRNLVTNHVSEFIVGVAQNVTVNSMANNTALVMPASDKVSSNELTDELLTDISEYWWLLVIILLVIHNVILRKRYAKQKEQEQVLKAEIKEFRSSTKQVQAPKSQSSENEPEISLQSQKQMANYEKLATLGCITAGVAHEVNNPNNFVNLSADMLGKELAVLEAYLSELAGEDADPEIIASFRRKFESLYNYLETIKDGTKRVKIIVEGLRTYTQENDSSPKVIRLTELIESTVRLVQSQYKKIIEFRLQCMQCPEIECYPSKLNQILMNLIVNACHAIEQKHQQNENNEGGEFFGRVTIACSQIEHEGQSMAEITINDTGCGMSDETKAKVFEPFYTTKGSEKGTGLGLSISTDLVAEHKGQLSVESQVNKGTTFTLRIPTKIN